MYKTLRVMLTHTDTHEEFWIEYDIFENSLSQKWAKSLHEDYINDDNVILDKNFCLHGWSDMHTRNLEWLCNELNWHIDKVNEYLSVTDIDHSVDMKFDSDTVDQKQLNEIHRHFEVLMGHHETPNPIFQNAPKGIRFSINQFNHFCHEMEGLLWSRNKDASNSIGSIIVCLYPNVKHDIELEHLSQFKMQGYRAGDVRLHYPQTGKQFIEAYLSGDTNVPMEDIQPIKYVSGEFDLVFHDIDVDWEGFRNWLKDLGVNQNDPTNALGYAIIARWRIPEDHQWWYRKYIQMFNNVQRFELLDENNKLLASRDWPNTWQQQYYWQLKQSYGNLL